MEFLEVYPRIRNAARSLSPREMHFTTGADDEEQHERSPITWSTCFQVKVIDQESTPKVLPCLHKLQRRTGLGAPLSAVSANVFSSSSAFSFMVSFRFAAVGGLSLSQTEHFENVVGEKIREHPDLDLFEVLQRVRLTCMYRAGQRGGRAPGPTLTQDTNVPRATSGSPAARNSGSTNRKSMGKSPRVLRAHFQVVALFVASVSDVTFFRILMLSASNGRCTRPSTSSNFRRQLAMDRRWDTSFWSRPTNANLHGLTQP